MIRFANNYNNNNYYSFKSISVIINNITSSAYKAQRFIIKLITITITHIILQWEEIYTGFIRVGKGAPAFKMNFRHYLKILNHEIFVNFKQTKKRKK